MKSKTIIQISEAIKEIAKAAEEVLGKMAEQMKEDDKDKQSR